MPPPSTRCNPSAATISTLYPVADGEQGLARALEMVSREASQLVWSGTTIVILSDRGADETMAPIPPLLATAAVYRDCSENLFSPVLRHASITNASFFNCVVSSALISTGR